MGLKMVKAHRAWFAALAGFGALVIAGGVAGLAGTGDRGNGPTPAVNAVATETPAAVVSPETLSEPEGLSYPDSLSAPRTLPLGTKVAADPVRVHTGDGDCLNVRPTPGTSFGIDPYTCVPEGTLLWLYGEARDADGETWRLALGAGWVAVRYTKPTEKPAIAPPSNKAMVLLQVGEYVDEKSGGSPAGATVTVRNIDPQTGEFGQAASFPGYMGGLGDRAPELSPSGRFVSFSRWAPDGSAPTALVGVIASGRLLEYPGWAASEWGAGDRLLLTRQICENTCKTAIAYVEAASGALKIVVEEPGAVYPVGWSADGSTLYGMTEERAFFRIDLAGGTSAIGALTGEQYFGFALPSPDGSKLLGGGGFTNTNVLDLRTAAILQFQRAPQREVGGKCGGSFSRVDGWLDNNRIFYHERSSSNRQDGITIGDLRDGSRRVLPFYNVQHLNSPAKEMLLFSTWTQIDDLQFEVTFLLDTVTGDSVPLFVGSGARLVPLAQ